jgi:glucose/arabinose dehydrogenase
MTKTIISFFLAGAFLLLLSIPSKSQYVLREAYPSLSFNNLTDLISVPDGRNQLYALTQAGIIYRFPQDPAAANQAEVFLNITNRVVAGGERGLLGLAFHPNFQTNGFFYVNYTAGNPLETRISRFTRRPDNPDQADPASEQVLLRYTQPFDNHNGGKIAFGPDGFLYISSGDGGSGGDPQNNAQNRQNLLGNILRINVDATTGQLPYGIPADNPFVGNTEGFREEIFAYGLRNVWKFSFDRTTGQLWAADVGQNNKEEINIITRGGNYGWRIMEGTSCHNPSQGCNTAGLVLPVYEYAHSAGIGRSITGGYVYRGSSLPALQGKYIYADYVSGNIWALGLRPDGTVSENNLLLNAGFLVSGFGEDQNQELLVLNHGEGRKIFRLADILTSVAEAEQIGWEVFPNPAESRLTVRWGEASGRGPASLKVYDGLGQQVLSTPVLLAPGAKEATLDISGWPKGLYAFCLESGEKRLWKKVLIQ